MVERHAHEPRSGELDAVFHALADGTRRAMLVQLAGGTRTVSELAAPHDMSLAAASKHVKVLERAGLLRREIEGRTHRCHLEDEPLDRGVAWIREVEAFWTERLDALEAALRAEDGDRPTHRRGGRRRDHHDTNDEENEQ